MTKEEQTIRDDLSDIVLVMRGIKIDDEHIKFTLNTYDRHNEHKHISGEDAFRTWLSLANILAEHPSFADMLDWQKQILKMPEDFLMYQVQKQSESEVKH
jgi:hypothetical protein